MEDLYLNTIALLADRVAQLENQIKELNHQVAVITPPPPPLRQPLPPPPLFMLAYTGFNTFSDGLHLAWELAFEDRPRKLDMVVRQYDGSMLPEPMDLRHQHAVMFTTQVQLALEIENMQYMCFVGRAGVPISLIYFVQQVELWLRQVPPGGRSLAHQLTGQFGTSTINFLKLTPAPVIDTSGIQDHLQLELC